MAIIIRNVSNNVAPTGRQKYELRINYELICKFSHIREEGLATCLRKAADAVERAEKKRDK